MIGKEDVVKVLEKAVSLAKGFDLEVSLNAEDLSLTRFYENHIHQNLRRQDHVLTVRVIKDRKIGVAQANLLDDGSLRSAVMSALENAEVAGEEEDFPGLPKPQEIKEMASYVPATASYRPADRAEACGIVISMAKAKGLEAAGSFATVARETAVANTLGVRAYHASTEAFFRCIVQSGPNTGYADRLTRDVREITFEDVAREAIEKATLYPDAKDLPPGRYDTIFLEYALADLIRFLGMYSFGAEAKQQGRSFMASRMGQKVMGGNITIWDDGLDGRGLAVPFDSEGVPKKKVVLIDKGVAAGVVYDSRTAAKDGVKSTGHAGPSEGRFGPLPGNMFLAEGESTLDEMIANTSRGLLVTRFHYTHCPEPVRVIATGTTRDGTFLIEGGRIVARVKNLRFTESMVEAFSRVESISKSSRLTRDWWGTFSSVLPAVKIKEFTFTGATSF
ncbi:MAG TPA: TldD/PmbA family protein [Firmicutes bacterium]|nr:TldD/PmbA family protein [Candidatus Fermentithermobacillaceae bacterium]